MIKWITDDSRNIIGLLSSDNVVICIVIHDSSNRYLQILKLNLTMTSDNSPKYFYKFYTMDL